MLPFLLFTTINVEASNSITDQVNEHSDQVESNPSNTVEEINNKVNESRENFNFEGSFEKFQSISIPMLVVVVFISACLFLLGWLIPSLKVKAWSLIGVGILSYIFIMFPQNIVGAIMAAIDWVFSLFY